MGSLYADQLSKSFGIDTIFDNIGFEIQSGEKVGLIGANGAGKTTLMRCLLGLEPLDKGQVRLSPGATIGYVRQQTVASRETVYAYLEDAYADVLECQRRFQDVERRMAAEKDENELARLMKAYAADIEYFERAGGYHYASDIRRVAFGLGFADEDMARPVATLSGGQQTRLNLAKALCRKPDFLFLDEPTNHLDIAMVEWLEEFLQGYAGSVFIISHDRYFLDNTVSRIFDLQSERLVAYSGNYSRYLEQKAMNDAALLSAYEKQQRQIAKTEEYIRRYKAGIKSKQARGRQSQLSRLERIELMRQDKVLAFDLPAPAECADRVAELIDVTAGYGDRTVFARQSLLVRRGEAVALVGPNGAGKTTLLKLLTGELDPREGRVKKGSRVHIGYFAQQHETLSGHSTLLDEIVHGFGMGEERARGLLGHFLFCGDDVFKQVGDLSGGEKARLALLKLMLSGANVLLLDEPTNHLDIAAKEAVETALAVFPGTIVAVSHDRYFLDRVADRVVELDDGRLTEYLGNYSFYRQQKLLAARQAAGEKQRAAATKPAASSPAPKKRPSDAAKAARRLEEEIAGLEVELAACEAALNDPATHGDPATSRRAAERYAACKEALDAKYGEWLVLTEQP
ncbi:MAG: ABC-F family ATP-binding cassette domain-containing protein [Sporomusaceae bacterium]|nr:ABC-F family ATP-binding cassette domain-containing protein [Sporomusaceae bacterium]